MMKASHAQQSLKTKKQGIRDQETRWRRCPFSKQTHHDFISKDGSSSVGHKRNSVGSTSRRSSDVYPLNRRPKPKACVQNTYQLSPQDSFPVQKVEEIMKDVMEEHLSQIDYDSVKMGIISRALADVIKDRVKALSVKRFKIICCVVIGEKGNYTIKTVSRNLWDAEFDRSATYVYENESLHATGMVYAVYYD